VTRPILYLFALLFLASCSATNIKPAVKAEKINGISFVATPREIDSTAIQPMMETGANWVAIMPFGFMDKLNSTEVVYNIDYQWWGEKSEGARITGEFFKDQGVKVLFKPQIWISRGEYTGYIKMDSEAEWKELEQSYENFILTFAQDAEDKGFEMFCIATELESFIDERPEYWSTLIQKIKTIYSGQLTYAGNWDAYKRFPFWDELDYVGVDAYFPLSEEETPSLESMEESWQQWENELRSFSENHSKPILFTEYGYRSVNYTAKEPWQSGDHTQAPNFDAQVNALNALFENVWDEEWFAGGFLWKWHYKYAYGKRNRYTGTGYTPQDKPALKTVTDWYTKYKEADSQETF